MDSVSDDFSGLPERKSRGERRAERKERKFAERRAHPFRGHRTRILMIGGFVIAVFLIVISLIVLFAPTPYLGTSHSALASSVGAPSAQDCRPAGGSWICLREAGSGVARYEVTVDWAGCWNGELAGPRSARSNADRTISGCVAIIDHIKAD